VNLEYCSLGVGLSLSLELTTLAWDGRCTLTMNEIITMEDAVSISPVKYNDNMLVGPANLPMKKPVIINLYVAQPPPTGQRTIAMVNIILQTHQNQQQERHEPEKTPVSTLICSGLYQSTASDTEKGKGPDFSELFQVNEKQSQGGNEIQQRPKQLPLFVLAAKFSDQQPAVLSVLEDSIVGDGLPGHPAEDKDPCTWSSQQLEFRENDIRPYHFTSFRSQPSDRDVNALLSTLLLGSL
ncbi:hypothetical protein STEG23_010636, partial [Scotinomys teguina]